MKTWREINSEWRKRCYGICGWRESFDPNAIPEIKELRDSTGEGQARAVENRRDVRMIKLSDAIDYRWWTSDNRGENDKRTRLMKLEPSNDPESNSTSMSSNFLFCAVLFNVVIRIKLAIRIILKIIK